MQNCKIIYRFHQAQQLSCHKGKCRPLFWLTSGGTCDVSYCTPANRHKIKGLLLSGVIATAITGITEPIEFLFLFISPLLWLFHVIMTGLGFMVMALLGVVIGNTDGGLLDFVILACYKELIQNGGGFSLSALSGLLFIISSLKQSL